MKINKTAINLIAISVFFLLSGCIQMPTAAPTVGLPSTSAPTQTPQSFSSITPTTILSSTPTPSPVLPTPMTTADDTTASSAVIPVGPGGADVIPHQIVRTNNDYLHIFTSQQSSKTLRVYRTSNPGLPDTPNDFVPPLALNESSEPISVDALYDGEHVIHVLINTQAGEVIDYPFDTVTNTFQSPIILAANSGTVSSDLNIGMCGISGMLDANGIMHIVYWTNNDHIIYGAYTYNSKANILTPTRASEQIDLSGDANHPVLAISPLDGSITVAWVSQTNDPAQILARTYLSDTGTWGNIDIVVCMQRLSDSER